MQRGRSRVSLMDLIDAGLIKPGQVLQAWGRGRNEVRAQAQVTSKGTVKFEGQEYNSLSSAATATTHGAANGWVVWRINFKDDWIPISELRDKVLSTSGTGKQTG